MIITTSLTLTYGISMCTGENKVFVYINHNVKGQEEWVCRKYHIKCNGAGMMALSRVLESDEYKVSLIDTNILQPWIIYRIQRRK